MASNFEGTPVWKECNFDLSPLMFNLLSDPLSLRCRVSNEWLWTRRGFPPCGFYSFQITAIPCNTFWEKELSYWNMFEDRNWNFTHSGTKFSKKMLIMFQNLFLEGMSRYGCRLMSEWVSCYLASEWAQTGRGVCYEPLVSWPLVRSWLFALSPRI